MLIVMKPQASEEEIRGVCRKVEALGLRAHPIHEAQRTAIGITGNQGPLEPAEFEALAGVAEAIPACKPYKLVSREVKSEDTIIRVGPADNPVTIGGRELAIIAGRCAIESAEQASAGAGEVGRAAAASSRALPLRAGGPRKRGSGAAGPSLLPVWLGHRYRNHRCGEL